MSTSSANAVPEGPGVAFSRIERGNLHGEVVAVLRDMIIQDELPPGTRIQEAELCQQFGVSRTPLREAVRVLVSEGLVTLLPRRGAVVATPTLGEIKGLFYALGALESVCAPMACANFTKADIQFVEREHAAMLEHHAAVRLKDYYRANQSIHQRIVQGSGNQFLVELHGSLSIRIMRDRYFVAVPAKSWARAIKEHDEMIGLLQTRNGARLAELIQEHMAGSWKDFEAGYGRENAIGEVDEKPVARRAPGKR
ncbi:MAG: GntR family transcriptional regulator [Betaproteobacteria bacterium]